MDVKFGSAIRPELFPIAVSVFLPGAVVSLIPLLFTLEFWPVFSAVLHGQDWIIPSALAFVVLYSGMVIEALGILFERELLDQKIKAKTNVPEEWEKYLKLSFPAGEPIGHRYLRTQVTNLKFHINNGIAIAICGTFLPFVLLFWAPGWILLLIFPFWGIVSFHFYQARDRARLLAQIRHIVLEAQEG